MKCVVTVVLALLIAGNSTRCYAERCNCDVWVERGGYCVDYIKDRIPSFQIPTKDEMAALKNTEVEEVAEGDVVVFAIKNYWHVAYVEAVRRNWRGEATAIDVSEKNFGDGLSFAEFKARWKSKSRHEWSRAVCCGITENYDLVTWRKNVSLDTVKQVWSPDDAAAEGGRLRVNALVDKVKEVLNKFFDYTETEL